MEVRPLPSALKHSPTQVVVARRREFMALERAPETPYLPVQAPPVDRSPSARNLDGTPQLHVTLWDRTFVDIDGKKKIIRMSRFGPFGLDPNDPCRPFSLAAPFSVAICPTLASYAMAGCGRW